MMAQDHSYSNNLPCRRMNRVLPNCQVIFAAPRSGPKSEHPRPRVSLSQLMTTVIYTRDTIRPTYIYHVELREDDIER